MSNVVSVVGVRNDDIARADALECLDTWRARVESGEITSVAVAGVGPGRAEYGHSSWVDERLVGACAILTQKMAALVSED
jgi:hypothetical protein